MSVFTSRTVSAMTSVMTTMHSQSSLRLPAGAPITHLVRQLIRASAIQVVLDILMTSAAALENMHT